MSDCRLKKIYEAGSKLFINQGYSNTQIRHIVKETGISTGALYSMFTEKKAILDFVLKCTIDHKFIDSNLEFPLSVDSFSGLEEEIKATLDKNDFAQHLSNGAKDYDFKSMVSDAFDVMAQFNVGCLILENRSKEYETLTEYYIKCREKFFKTFAEYITIYIKQNKVRQLDKPLYSIRLMMEILSWWAMDVHFKSLEDNKAVPMNLAKEVCLDNILNAYAIK